MFNNYTFKILNDDQNNIIVDYIHKYCLSSKLYHQKPFLYIENTEITIENLIKCNDIYLLYPDLKTQNKFEFLNNNYFVRKFEKNKDKIDKFKFIWLGKINNLSINVYKNFRKQIQNIFTLLYYIFTTHNNAYLPEISKYIFIKYYDVIFSYPCLQIF